MLGRFMTPDPLDELDGYTAEEKRIIQASQCASQARFDRRCWEAINFLSSYAQELYDAGKSKGKDPNERIPSFMEILSGSCRAEPNEFHISNRQMDTLFEVVMRGAIERHIGFQEAMDYIDSPNRPIWIRTAARYHQTSAQRIVKERDAEVFFRNNHPRSLHGPHSRTVGDTIFEDASLASRIVFTGDSIQIFRKTGDAVVWRFVEGWCDVEDCIDRKIFSVSGGEVDFRSNPRQESMTTERVSFYSLEQFFWTLESLSM